MFIHKMGQGAPQKQVLNTKQGVINAQNVSTAVQRDLDSLEK